MKNLIVYGDNTVGNDNLLPSSVEAEESVVATVLLNSSSDLGFLDKVMEELSVEDFYKLSHREIFKSMEELLSKGEPVDLVTVTGYLRSRGRLQKIGGVKFLSELVETIPITVNPNHYIKIIKEKSLLRKMIDKSSQIAELCYQDKLEVEEIIEFAENSIFKISDSKTNKTFSSIGESVQININSLENRQGGRSLISGIPTGFYQIDRLTSGLQNSDLIIIAGRPAMGKTALALNIAKNAALKSKKTVMVFSLEMSKEQLSMRMLCTEARVDSSKIRSGLLSTRDWNKLIGAAGRLTDIPVYIDDSEKTSISSIRSKSRRLKLDKNLGLIIVDYIQLLRSTRRFDRRDLEISEISRSLKMLAKELNIPIIALSQLNRKLEERSDKRPQLSDLRESGALEQDADIVAFIYRDEVYNKDDTNPNAGTAEIIISKQRNGPTGYVILSFISSYTCFEDLEVS